VCCLRGFRPSSRHHRARPLHARVPRPSLRSVHELSQLLDGLRRAPASRACFIPQPRPGFVRVQGLLPRFSQAFSSKVAAPMPFGRGPSPTNLGCQVQTRRLRGFDPQRGAFHRPGFSRSDSRCPPHVLAPPGPPLFAFRAGLPSALRSCRYSSYFGRSFRPFVTSRLQRFPANESD
jgi:hypothetical protein